MFGHTIGRSIGLGYVRTDDGPVTADWLAAGRYELEIADGALPGHRLAPRALRPDERADPGVIVGPPRRCTRGGRRWPAPLARQDAPLPAAAARRSATSDSIS